MTVSAPLLGEHTPTQQKKKKSKKFLFLFLFSNVESSF